MKKFALLALALVVGAGNVSAANSDRKVRATVTPAMIMAILNTIDGLPCGGCSMFVEVVDIEDVERACCGCAHREVLLLPEAEVSCHNADELRAFSRAECQKKGRKKATRLVIRFDLPDMKIIKDKDGYSVEAGSLTISLPKNIVEVVVRPDEVRIDMTAADEMSNNQ